MARTSRNDDTLEDSVDSISIFNRRFGSIAAKNIGTRRKYVKSKRQIVTNAFK